MAERSRRTSSAPAAARPLPLLRALLVHPLLGLLATAAAFVILAAAGESGDAAITAAYAVPLSLATLATGFAVIARRRGPVAGLLLSIATALVTVLLIGAVLLVLLVVAYTPGEVDFA